MAALGVDQETASERPVFDTSDEISADYIVNRMKGEAAQGLIVIDYLQLLDQTRTKPSVKDQIAVLRQYVNETGAICILLSQIDRSFDLDARSMPDLSAIRRPNPLDLSAFSKLVFLHDGKIQLTEAS